MKKTFIQHSGAFILSVLLAVIFLLLGACLPQDPIDANVLDSAAVMRQQGDYPVMADHAFASMLDYTTDALILAESKATTIHQWDTILTNPVYAAYGTDTTTVEQLYQYALDPDPQPSRFYVQYWMGFRPVVRLLLTFLDYYQILRYTAVAFFVLLAAAACSIARRAGTRAAFMFMLSIIFVRPHVISVSLQFSCCFLISFLAMLAVPWIHRAKKWDTLFFLELGILTQYFDFYTTPVLTFALPMTYLYLLRSRERESISVKQLGANGLCWFAGYVLMWLAKLVLTTLLTDVNALQQGFSSFSGRIGIEKVSGMEELYDPLTALRTVAASLYSDREGKLVLLTVAAVACLALLYHFLRNRHTLGGLFSNWQLLLIAALPVFWFLIASQPTANHHWFQYRGIAATFWAGMLYLQLLMQREPDTLSHS